jgi:hypothetical protein
MGCSAFIANGSQGPAVFVVERLAQQPQPPLERALLAQSQLGPQGHAGPQGQPPLLCAFALGSHWQPIWAHGRHRSWRFLS